MIDGKTITELGLLAYAEACARGEIPDATMVLVSRALQLARLEAAVREAALYGVPLRGTSALKTAGKAPFVA